MSPRAFLILLAITAATVLVALLAALQPTVSQSEPGQGPMFPALAAGVADARRVVVRTPDYAATWEYRDGKWVSPERGDFPARTSAVTDLIAGLAGMVKVEPKTANPDWYPYIRVGDPTASPPTGAAHLTVSSASGEVLADAIVGSRSYSIPASHARGGSFVRAADDAQSWQVEGQVTIPPLLSDWFGEIVDIPGPDIAGVAVLLGERTVFEARKDDAAAGNYTLVSVDPAAAPDDAVAASAAIRGMAAAIVGVKVEDVRSREGLTIPADARTDRFVTTAGMTLDITFVDADGTTWAIFRASAPAGSAGAEAATAINALTRDWAFALDASRLRRLTRPIGELAQTPEGQAAGQVVPSVISVPGGPGTPETPLPGVPAPTAR